MALTKCKDCGHDVSFDASACPHCGSPPPKRSIFTRPVTAKDLRSLLVIGIIIYIFAAIHKSPPPATDRAPPAPSSAAYDTTATSTNKLPAKVEQSLATTATEKEPEVDYAKPLYTKRYAVICPLGIIFDRRADHGLDGAERAAMALFSRAEKLKEVGCEEWKSGIRIYIEADNKGRMWQEFRLSADDPSQLLIMGWDVTNDPHYDPLGVDKN